MLKALKTLLLAGAALALVSAAQAQTYPTQNPGYQPNPVLAATTFTAAGDYTFPLNGTGELLLRVAGSGTGIAGVVQMTEAKSGTINWTTVPVYVVGGLQQASISATGLYRVPVSGAAQVRFHLTAVTGSISVSASAGPGLREVVALPQLRASYSGAASIATGATTHFLSIAGSATKTVRVTHAECSGRATAALAVGITAEVDSTADTVDAGTGVTLTPHDSTNPAATAVLVSHTTSPTSGALVGVVRGGTLSIVNAATPVYQSGPLSWDFGIRPGSQEIVLRGVAQSFSLNTSAAFGSGAAVNCVIEETEE